MRREQRLRRSSDFAAVYRGRRSLSAELLAVRSLKTDQPVSRVGFVVSKRLGKAVVRNRVKRRLRAALTSVPLVAGFDVVVIARPAAATRDFAALQAALAGLLQRAGLVQRGTRAAPASRAPSGVSAGPGPLPEPLDVPFGAARTP